MCAICSISLRHRNLKRKDPYPSSPTLLNTTQQFSLNISKPILVVDTTHSKAKMNRENNSPESMR